MKEKHNLTNTFSMIAYNTLQIFDRYKEISFYQIQIYAVAILL
jgi:hypothetical protein